MNRPAPFMVVTRERECACPHQYGNRCFGQPEMEKVYTVEFNWEQVGPEFPTYDEAHAYAESRYDLWMANRKQCAKRMGGACTLMLTYDGDVRSEGVIRDAI